MLAEGPGAQAAFIRSHRLCESPERGAAPPTTRCWPSFALANRRFRSDLLGAGRMTATRFGSLSSPAPPQRRVDLQCHGQRRARGLPGHFTAPVLSAARQVVIR